MLPLQHEMGSHQPWQEAIKTDRMPDHPRRCRKTGAAALDVAVGTEQANADHAYPAGAVLDKVTQRGSEGT